MHDPGPRWNDSQSRKRGLPPFQERIAFPIALELKIGILRKRILRAEIIGLHGMIDHQFDRLQWIDRLWVAAHLCHCVAHRRQIDDARDAGKVLQQDARRRERNFALLPRVLPRARKRFDIVRALRRARLQTEADSRVEFSAKTASPRVSRRPLLPALPTENSDTFVRPRATYRAL